MNSAWTTWNVSSYQYGIAHRGCTRDAAVVAGAVWWRREPFIAACRDHVTNGDLEPVAEFQEGVSELAECAATVVDGSVDGIDVVVAGGRDRHVLPPVADAGPVLDEVVDMLKERCRKIRSWSPDWPSGSSKQQIHVDLWVDDIDEAHDRVMTLGARVLKEVEPSDELDAFQVYADPAGHPFCLCWITPR
jgi:hypothetical protein